jgi:hypothetical protein
MLRQSALPMMPHRVSCAAMKPWGLMLVLCTATPICSQQANTKAGTDSTLTQTGKLLGAFGGTWSIAETYDPSGADRQAIR